MPQYNYAFQGYNKELMARAVGRDTAVSTKQAIEISNYLRHRKLLQAKTLLGEVIEKKRAVPFKRFTDGLGHRRGKMASGRFPVKASRAFLKLLESAEASAQTKGLNTSELEIIHICSHKAHCPVHYGRHSGREFKRTHIELVVQETAGKDKDGKGKKAKKSKVESEPKSESKPETKAVPEETAKETVKETKPVEKKEEPKVAPKVAPKEEAKEEPKEVKKAEEVKDVPKEDKKEDPSPETKQEESK